MQISLPLNAALKSSLSCHAGLNAKPVASILSTSSALCISETASLKGKLYCTSSLNYEAVSNLNSGIESTIGQSLTMAITSADLEALSASPSVEPLPVAATSFPRFSLLPAEIRQIIWENATSPRIVYLEQVFERKHTCSRVWSQTSIEGPDCMGFFDLDHQPEEARIGAGPYPPWGFRTRSIPPLFLVCRESYRVAKEKIYKKSFGSKCALPRTWFNFELDTLYLDWGYYESHKYGEDGILFDFDSWDFGEDIKRVQHLAIYKGKHPICQDTGGSIKNVLSTSGHVQDLVLAPPDYKPDDAGDLVFLEWDDVIDDPAYSDGLHPVVADMFPGLENDKDLFEMFAYDNITISESVNENWCR